MWWKIGLSPGSLLVYFGTYNQVFQKQFMKQYRSPNYCLPSENTANNVYLLVGFCQNFRVQIEACFGFKQLPELFEPNFWLRPHVCSSANKLVIYLNFRISLRQ